MTPAQAESEVEPGGTAASECAPRGCQAPSRFRGGDGAVTPLLQRQQAGGTGERLTTRLGPDILRQDQRPPDEVAICGNEPRGVGNKMIASAFRQAKAISPDATNAMTPAVSCAIAKPAATRRRSH